MALQWAFDRFVFDKLPKQPCALTRAALVDTPELALDVLFFVARELEASARSVGLSSVLPRAVTGPPGAIVGAIVGSIFGLTS